MSIIEKLLSKVSKALAEEGTVENLKVHFKKAKEKAFLKLVCSDIDEFYSEENINEIKRKIKEDNKVLSSEIFVVSAVDRINGKFGNKKEDTTDYEALTNSLNVWDIYKEVQCQKAVHEAYAESDIFTEEQLAMLNEVYSNVSAVLSSAKSRLTSKHADQYFTKKLVEMNTEVNNYKAMINILL